MTSDPKRILSEFGIDVDGKDPDGQYQWKMLSLRAGSEERKRLEKAWSAFVLGRTATEQESTRSTVPPHPRTRARRWARVWWVAVVVIAVAGTWFLLSTRGSTDDRSNSPENAQQPIGDWRAQYEAIKPILNENDHKDEHHEEFVLLAEAARNAIRAGQASAMLDRMNADLTAERDGTGTKPITTLEQHTEQWKIIVQALVLNKAELLDHDRFKDHHQGEL